MTERLGERNPQEGDERLRVRESGLGVDIVIQAYGLVSYTNREKEYGWRDMEEFHIRADHVEDLLGGLEDVDLERLVENLEELRELDRALSGGQKSATHD